MLASADAISVHARLTPQTRSMFGPAEFSRMKPTALFVNTARGQLVNSRALAEALANETIAGAALDVFDNEPLDRNSVFNSFSKCDIDYRTSLQTLAKR